MVFLILLLPPTVLLVSLMVLLASGAEITFDWGGRRYHLGSAELPKASDVPPTTVHRGPP